MIQGSSILPASAVPEDVHQRAKVRSRTGTASTAGATLVTLQYLRAIAAMLVVYYHAVFQLNTTGLAPPGTYPLLGRSGVDIFFVLSGLVMWISTASREESPGRFIRRRIARIVPLYWTATIGAALVALIAPQLLRSTIFDIPHILASLFFIPWPNPMAVRLGYPEYIIPVVVPGWTLNFEMLFYLVFASTLLLPARLRVSAILLLMALVFGISNLLAPLGAAPTFYSSDIIFEFAAGVALGAFVVPRLNLKPIACMSLMAIGMAGLLLLDFLAVGGIRSITLGIPAFVIVAGAMGLEKTGAVPMSRLLDDLGDASYSIYLVHIFVIAGLRVLFRIIDVDQSVIGGAVFILLAIIVSAAVGWIVFTQFERPAVRRAKRLLRV